MAIAFDNSAAGAYPTRGGSSETNSYTMGSVSNGYLLVLICRNDDTANHGDDVTGVTYNGVSMTRLASLDDTGGGAASNWAYFYIYGLANPASGAHNYVISLTGSTGSRAYNGAISYSGVSSTEPDATASNTASASGVTATLNVATANSWAVAIAGQGDGPFTGSGSLNSTARNSPQNVISLLDSNATLTTGNKSITATGVGGTNRKSVLTVSIKPFSLVTSGNMFNFF